MCKKNSKLGYSDILIRLINIELNIDLKLNKIYLLLSVQQLLKLFLN